MRIRFTFTINIDRARRVEYVSMPDGEPEDEGPPHVDVKDARIERRPQFDYDTQPVRVGFA